ncbi:hypothetical protein ncot_08945 [Nocardioides sp. JQ2195]|uniref:DUF5703 family protein n=1 Tax=Nocardioides sp. JQ2195 TaxID=2592334 RepID=UPI00143E16CA|nr:DUF5703 family protein [Nocardioides sp. JQ2195]QIX26717.1 hypothetical protein ncot_08945 [Nocardioides sp. JQ2195]
MAVARQAFRKNVEWEYDQFTLPRDLSRSAVTRLLVERAEVGGWELRSVRIHADGVRRIRLRRKIIRQPRPDFYYV